MKAIEIEAFGNPAEVVKAVDIPDIGAPAAGEVVITLEASPINQHDLLMIAGGYGYRPRPAIMGTERVGRAPRQFHSGSAIPCRRLDTGRLNARAPEPCAKKILEVL
jgi:hypothetical protein